MPFICPDGVVGTKVDLDGRLLCEDVKEVNGDFFAVFCVVVRLHSKRIRKKKKEGKKIIFYLLKNALKTSLRALDTGAHFYPDSPEFSESLILPQHR